MKPAGFDALLAEVAPLADRFVAAGHRLYLVGGIVRDGLLGRDTSTDPDLDLTTDAAPAAVRALVAPLADAVWRQGERFGTIGARIGGRSYEITTHRAEAYTDDSRKPVVRFSSSVVDDLSRRDFTVNAMAVEVPSGELVDPFGGAGDLAAQVLRTPLDPHVSFSDDPLRMLRAARFSAGYKLTPRPELVASMAETAPRLAIVSMERVRDELDKLLAVAAPRRALELLVETGVATRFLPELDDPSTRRVAFGALDALVASHPELSPAARLATLLHPLAPESVRARVAALRASHVVSRYVVALATAWRRIAALDDADASARRLVHELGPVTDDALRVASCVPESAGPAALLADRLHVLRARGELDSLEPALGGDEIMRALGIGPGPAVGDAAAFVLTLRLDEGVRDPEVARARLEQWWAERASRVEP